MRHTLLTPFVVTALFLSLTVSCRAHAQTEPGVRDLEPRPVAAADDPVNKFAAKTTVDGLVLAVTIDGAVITLDNAMPARIPRATSRKPGDSAVTAIGFAQGVKISQISVADQQINVQEGVGVVSVTKRQVILALPAPRALDTVEISAPASGAKARIDVRSVYSKPIQTDEEGD
jgi:predicted NAD/FAD-dependent oxidoreductase